MPALGKTSRHPFYANDAHCDGLRGIIGRVNRGGRLGGCPLVRTVRTLCTVEQEREGRGGGRASLDNGRAGTERQQGGVDLIWMRARTERLVIEDIPRLSVRCERG